jgi:transposase-like protein
MDTYTQPVATTRQYRTLEEKQRIVGEALAEGASVARVARAHGVNANLVFNWCRLYRKRPSCTVLLSVHESVKWTLRQMWDGDSKVTVLRCG